MQTTQTAVAATTTDPFALLLSEHDEQRGLLAQLEGLTVTDAHRVKPLVHQLVAAEHAHTFAEAEALHPAMPKFMGEEGSRQLKLCEADDQAVTAALTNLQHAAPEADFVAWKGALTKVSDALRAHLQREQNDVFPALKAKMSSADMDALHAALVSAKGRAPAPTLLGAIVDSAKGFVAAIGNLLSGSQSAQQQH